MQELLDELESIRQVLRDWQENHAPHEQYEPGPEQVERLLEIADSLLDQVAM